jgi:DNA-binding transcriptional LysR family regulator
MELRHLRYFVVAAEEENFNRAAERLRVAQPALSRRIHDLEEKLGVALFERRQKRVYLTSIGRAYYEDIRRILQDLDRAGAKSRRMARGEAGTLSLGVNHTVLRVECVAKAVQMFHARHPDVDLQLDPMKLPHLLDTILEGHVDAAFLYTRPPDNPLIDHLRVSEDEFVLAMPARHPLASRDRIHLADLREEPFLWLKRENAPTIYDRLIAACAEASFSPAIVQHITSESTRLHLVAAGMGVAFVTSSFQSYAPEAVATRKVEDLSVKLVLDFAWRRDNRSPLLDRFLEILKSTLDSHQRTSAGA